MLDQNTTTVLTTLITVIGTLGGIVDPSNGLTRIFREGKYGIIEGRTHFLK